MSMTRLHNTDSVTTIEEKLIHYICESQQQFTKPYNLNSDDLNIVSIFLSVDDDNDGMITRIQLESAIQMLGIPCRNKWIDMYESEMVMRHNMVILRNYPPMKILNKKKAASTSSSPSSKISSSLSSSSSNSVSLSVFVQVTKQILSLLYSHESESFHQQQQQEYASSISADRMFRDLDALFEHFSGGGTDRPTTTITTIERGDSSDNQNNNEDEYSSSTPTELTVGRLKYMLQIPLIGVSSSSSTNATHGVVTNVNSTSAPFELDRLSRNERSKPSHAKAKSTSSSSSSLQSPLIVATSQQHRTQQSHKQQSSKQQRTFTAALSKQEVQEFLFYYLPSTGYDNKNNDNNNDSNKSHHCNDVRLTKGVLPIQPTSLTSQVINNNSNNNNNNNINHADNDNSNNNNNSDDAVIVDVNALMNTLFDVTTTTNL